MIRTWKTYAGMLISALLILTAVSSAQADASFLLGRMTPEQGADLLAQPCPCGIFNTDRCEMILEQYGKPDQTEKPL